MSTVAATNAPSDPGTRPALIDPPVPNWLRRVDAVAARVGDRVNPILVKETRQALKSRQFVVTFSVLLLAALGWTVAGSLSMMPQIYTTPSAPRMLMGYYVVLAVPMLLVVPLAAYRSLENEIDDGTLELLSITTLSPWQIVLGKLASALLQLLLYFIVLFPCVAYAYTLRGVDLPSTLVMVGTLLAAGVLLTIVSLFFAPWAVTRSGRLMTLLVVMGLLLSTQYALGVMMFWVINNGVWTSALETFYGAVLVTCIAVPMGHLFLTATAAQLTPISENRSTSIRVSLLIFTAVIVGVGVAGAQLTDPIDAVGMVIGLVILLCVIWVIAGSMMVGESSDITPRIRRELPASFVGRAALTFLTPGPVTGLVLASAVGLVLVGGFDVWSRQVDMTGGSSWFSSRLLADSRRMLWTALAYAVGLLTAASWLMRLIRIRNSPRVEVGFAALVAVMVLSALVPYSIGFHFADYRSYPYNAFQLTNWFWTTVEASDGNATAIIVAVAVAVMATMALALTVFSRPKLMFPRRIALPRRVQQQIAQDRLASQPK